jgi:hypothetical protein
VSALDFGSLPKHKTVKLAEALAGLTDDQLVKVVVVIVAYLAEERNRYLTIYRGQVFEGR